MLVLAFALTFVLAEQATAAAATTWYSGMRAFGQVTVEPAVDMGTGEEIFLHTPNNAPFPSQAAPRAVAPLYLVLYPQVSTIPASILNCQPTNCDHAQTFFYPLKGHDHLVGTKPTGDFNVAWHVIAVWFTRTGFQHHAYNTRILTETQLAAGLQSGDLAKASTPIVFNCSITSLANYLHGTPLTFTAP